MIRPVAQDQADPQNESAFLRVYLEAKISEVRMRKVFEGHPVYVAVVKALLEDHGFIVAVQGEALFYAQGEFPAPPPSAWVPDEQYEKALEVIASARKDQKEHK